MTDISSHFPTPPHASVTPEPIGSGPSADLVLPGTTTRWYYDTTGRVVAVTEVGEPSIPEGWTLIPDADGQRLWNEQQIHHAEMFALEVQRNTQREESRQSRRAELLERMAALLEVDVEEVADAFGVPAPGREMPMVHPVPTMPDAPGGLSQDVVG